MSNRPSVGKIAEVCFKLTPMAIFHSCRKLNLNSLMDVENIRLSVQFLSGTSYNLNCVSFTSREKVYLFTRLMFNDEKKLNSYFFYS